MEQLQVIHDGYHAVERRTTRQPKRKTLTGYGKDMPTDTQVFFKKPLASSVRHML